MGCFGKGGFDNDDALDWVWKLDDAEDTTLLHETLSRITDSKGYLVRHDCGAAIAAAEVVAALRQRPAARLPKGVVEFVQRITSPPSVELVAQALQAIERIRMKSELEELWEDDSGWLDAIADLELRLE